MVADGRLDEKYIDRAVRRILTVKFRLGLFDAPYGDPEQVKKVVRSKEKIALSKAIADESAILLENKNGILPLDITRYKSIAVIGPNADQTVMGDYSWTTSDTDEGITLLQGLKNVVGDRVAINYAQGCDWWSRDKSKIAEAVEVARRSDIAIVAIGTRSTYLGRSPRYSTSGEGFDLSSLELPGEQLTLLKEIKKTGKPLIVVFIAGKPLAMPWVKENADALLVQWYAGEQQGNTLADILTGKVNPSGKVNVSFPRSTGNTPCFYNHYVTDREEPFDQPGTPDEPKGHYIFDKPDPLWNFGYDIPVHRLCTERYSPDGRWHTQSQGYSREYRKKRRQGSSATLRKRQNKHCGDTGSAVESFRQNLCRSRWDKDRRTYVASLGTRPVQYPYAESGRARRI